MLYYSTVFLFISTQSYRAINWYYHYRDLHCHKGIGFITPRSIKTRVKQRSITVSQRNHGVTNRAFPFPFSGQIVFPYSLSLHSEFAQRVGDSKNVAVLSFFLTCALFMHSPQNVTNTKDNDLRLVSLPGIIELQLWFSLIRTLCRFLYWIKEE